MGDILFLSHRIPFPPDRGDKIRSHHLLKALADIAPVHVATFGETDADMAAEKELAEVAASHCLMRRSKPLPLAGIQALASHKPVSLTAFDSPALRQWVQTILAERNIDTIFVFSGQMGQYIPDDFNGRVVVDLCDVDSAKFEAYGQKGSGPRQIIDRREGRLLRTEEARLALRADSTLLVSENEAELFSSRIDAALAARVTALRNGIDTQKFSPNCSVGGGLGEKSSNPFTQDGPHFVFTGQMDYQPNIDAATRAMDHILPIISAKHPQAMLHIVGRAPVEKLTRRNGEPGIKIWGEVPDVRPFLAHADIIVAPLTIARGIQNKVLEAMAMARPIVLSPEAATGIDATDGEHFCIAADDQHFAQRMADLLSNEGAAQEMGKAARNYVAEHQTWPAMLEPLGRIVQGGLCDSAGADTLAKATRHAA